MKRSQIKRRPMADSVLQSLESELKDYQELDSPGLYFRVKASGSKSWILRYKRANGKWAWTGLGSFPQVSGKAARAEARRLQDVASDGVDLHEYRKGAPQKPLFRAAAETWYQRKLTDGRSPKTTRQMRLYLDADILPMLGDKALDEVTRADCAALQSRLESRKAFSITKKVRSWVNNIFSLAIAQGLTENNPASELKHVAMEAPPTKNYPHLLEPELPDFLQALKHSPSRPITLVLVRMVLLTACRPGMARWAEWTEIDFDKALWTLPAHKMKAKRTQLVPLATQTLHDLQWLHQYTGHNTYVFPGQGPNNPVMSDNTINRSLAKIGYKNKLVGHGARHTASTLLREHKWDKDFVEAMLAHKEAGVAGVYNQAQYLEARREMMQWYADYLDQLTPKE